MGLPLETISILLRVFMPIFLFLFWISMGAFLYFCSLDFKIEFMSLI